MIPIYTVTPNPALDLSGHTPDILPNEKNYVHHARRDPGGNGINSARIAHRLGARVEALGFLGGTTGDEIEHLLDGEGVRHRFTPIKAETRTNVTVTNDRSHQQTRLTFPGPFVRAAESARLLRLIRSLRGPGLFILGGSLPQGCPKGYHRNIAESAKRAGLELVVDVPAAFLPPLLAARPLLIKPNQQELEEHVGRKLRSRDAIVEAAMDLAKKSRFVCVSLAQEGAILATRDRAWLGRAPRVKARGSVGAGDSMVGAMATQIALGLADLDRSAAEVLAWGLAAGAATAEASGTQLADPARIRALRKKASVVEL